MILFSSEEFKRIGGDMQIPEGLRRLIESLDAQGSSCDGVLAVYMESALNLSICESCVSYPAQEALDCLI